MRLGRNVEVRYDFEVIVAVMYMICEVFVDRVSRTLSPGARNILAVGGGLAMTPRSHWIFSFVFRWLELNCRAASNLEKQAPARAGVLFPEIQLSDEISQKGPRETLRVLR